MRFTGVVLLAALALMAVAVAPAHAALTYLSSFGEAGTGAGQFSAPGGIAVNDTTGDVYVADRTNHRIQQFDSDGAFIRMWGKGVDKDTGGNSCSAASGHLCGPGVAGGEKGQFDEPRGVAVDSSTGTVYVQDGNNNRVQAFTANGEFILTWGKRVNFSTDGDLCTAISGDTCRAGKVTTTGTVGQFSGWPIGNQPSIGVDASGYVYVGDPKAAPYSRIQKFTPAGVFLGQIAGPAQTFGDHGINDLLSLAVNAGGDAYAVDRSEDGRQVELFKAPQFSAPLGSAASWDLAFGDSATFVGSQVAAVDPSNQYVIVGNDAPRCLGTTGPNGYHLVEYSLSGQEVDCTVPTAPAVAVPDLGSVGGIAISSSHRLYLADPADKRVLVFGVPVAGPPVVGTQVAVEITTNKAVLKAPIAPNLAETTYHLEYGTSPCSTPGTCVSMPESSSIGAALKAGTISTQATGLTPNTTYYYRFVAKNSVGTTPGPDRSFSTYPVPVVDSSCPNNLARQQTAASLLLDCRAYELVSAPDTGGYNVESDLIPGEAPFAGFPRSDGRVLYGTHSGGIPNIGNPTNRGLDPYVATRDAANQRWTTKYVGIPAYAPSAAPFSSTLEAADAALTTFSFGGSDICDPCFPDGSRGVPLRLANGDLVQGMAGSLSPASPASAGVVKKALSGDGSHFVFGSTAQFEPGGNSSGTDATIYDRNLVSGATQVVSTLPDGSTIEAGEDVAELDVSEDGSRILIGRLVDTDAAGNRYWHLYMHVGTAAESIDLTPGAGSGVLYDGMTANGATVYFTTVDALTDDTDTSADIYRADVGAAAASLSRVSIGAGATGDTDSCDPSANSYNTSDWNVVPGGPTDCSVVATGGAGGVASSSGTIYFLSPEQLAGGDGVDGAPNLYAAAIGAAPRFVATLESTIDKPLPESGHNFVRTFGSFINPDGVAIDSATGSTYVLDNVESEESPGAFVQKFDSSGNVDTSFGVDGIIDGSNSPSGPFLEYGVNFGETGMPVSVAVDNLPSSPSYRDLYVPDIGHEAVKKFDSSGNYVSQLTIGDYPTGVAVNPANGNVYVAGLFGSVKIFDPSGNLIETLSVPAFQFSDIAVNSSGDFYLTEYSHTARYSAAGALIEVLGASSGISRGVTVDPSDNHVYIDQVDHVVEFDSSGTQVGQPIGEGKLDESVGLAVDSGRMVVSNKGGSNVVEFGPPSAPADRGYDSPLVVDSVREAEVRRTADLQVEPTGDLAVFASTLPLTGYESAGRYELFRYRDGSPGELRCISCNSTGSSPTTDASLASNGLSLTDDGRVFFTTGEPLVLRDTDAKKDAYEWSAGKVELISAGTSSFDSGLLTASADGKDAFFFTRDTLVVGDNNPQLMKIYDAREGGGFFVVPPPPPCVASDECHGAGSPAPGPPNINTAQGKGGNAASTEKCKKNFVKRKGKCVKRKKHHKPRKHHHRNGRANSH